MVGFLLTRLRELRWPALNAVLLSAFIRGCYHTYQGVGGFLGNFVMGLIFVLGQANEYRHLVHEGIAINVDGYGSMFYLTTGFHGLHVTGGLIAFLFVLGRTFVARKFTHEQAVSAIVVSYYWHFVDVVWIGLFATIYLIQ